jgi:hypothetical protein
MVAVTLRILNADRILRISDPQSLMAAPIRDAFDKATYKVHQSSLALVPVDTGMLKGSLRPAIDPTPLPRWATVGTNIEYARAVHDGRPPGFRPAVTPDDLRVWARRHGNMSPYALARTINRRGVAPVPYLVNALRDNRLAIQAIFQKAAKAIEHLWSQGA